VTSATERSINIKPVPCGKEVKKSLLQKNGSMIRVYLQ
jgi:hypothetical protein